MEHQPGHQINPSRIFEPLGNGPTAVDADDGGREAASRKFYILKRLAKSEHATITIDELQKDRNFTRRFKHVAKSTLEADFAEINKLIGGRSVLRTRSDLRLVARTDLLAADLGELAASGGQVSADSLNKNRIGRFTARRLAATGGRSEVLYLSTGSTVREVAESLFNEHVDKISFVLTDNFAIACLWWQHARRDGLARLPQLYILGGTLDFLRADVMQPRGKGQLDHWKCSTAVVSATGVNPRTGEIYSFRQEETKREFFKDASVQRVIIPVTSDKFEVLGGKMIFDPNDKNVKPDTGDYERKYEIVTTKIEPSICEQLKKYYEVHVVPDNYE
jgi:hypothetical protein